MKILADGLISTDSTTLRDPPTARGGPHLNDLRVDGGQRLRDLRGRVAHCLVRVPAEINMMRTVGGVRWEMLEEAEQNKSSETKIRRMTF